MSISVQYSSTRREVWGLYWRTWRRQLWKMHLVIFIATASLASFSIFGGWPKDIPQAALVLFVGVLPLAAFAMFPMLMFKPQIRVLTVDVDGIATIIGKHNKTVAWEEIADVRNSDDALVIQNRNLNAFIVPARAFTTSEARLSFEEFVRTHASSNVS